MDKGVGQFGSCGPVDRSLAGSGLASGAAPGVRDIRAPRWTLGMIADADPELDRADHDLRDREFRWPLIASIVLIVALSAGLWLGIFALVARLAGKA